MKRYVAILRGINVSGQKLIKMAELKAHVEDLGLSNVITYIQSGNIIFESTEEDMEVLSALIANKIKLVYGWDVPVIIRSKEEIEELINGNPHQVWNMETDKWYVTFLLNNPSPDLASAFAELKFGPDEFILKGKNLYGFVPISYGNTKFSNNFIESKLKTKASTRNWKTVLKILELMST